MTTPPPPNASPQPILPGVPVPFPCWLWIPPSDVKPDSRWEYRTTPFSRNAVVVATHYLVAPATADPATFPKAQIQNCPDGPGCTQDFKTCGVSHCQWPHCQSMPPSAGTEQKERGEPTVKKSRQQLARSLRWLAQLVQQGDSDEGQISFEEGDGDFFEVTSSFHYRAGKGLNYSWSFGPGDVDEPDAPAAPTDGTTAPKIDRTNAIRRAIVAFRFEDSYMMDNAVADILKECDAHCAARLALTQKRLGEAQKKQPINTHVRLFDLVRHQRAELHEADLITDEEYVWLCGEAPMATDPKGGSPSPRRLEDYDDLRAQLATSQAHLVEVEKERDREKQRADQEELAAAQYAKTIFDLRSALAQAKQEKTHLQESLVDISEKAAKRLIELEREVHANYDTIGEVRTANAQLQEQIAALRPQGEQDKLSP